MVRMMRLVSGGMRMAAILAATGAAISLSEAAASGQPSAPPPSNSSVARPAEAGADSVLPVRKITLYRSGVGYFERAAEIDGAQEIQLRFNTDQINDILKSMVLLDLDGGRIESVSYGSKEPLSKRLASFGINIADNPSAGEILQRLRGTPVRIDAPDGRVSGTILNVETRPTVYPAGGGGSGGGGGSATVHNLPWINLLTPTGVRSINLTTVSGFEILDAALAEELNKALSALAEYRADRTKTVDLRFSGSGSRRIVVGYVHEMPVWKTSYRLVLPETDSKDGTLFLQGWAIVENTTDQDWDNVRLGLVSGRPVSFQMDLYEPLFMARPWVMVPTISGVLPRAYALGESVDEEAGAAVQSSMEARRNAGRIMRSESMSAPPGAPAVGDSAVSFDKDRSKIAFGGVSVGEMVDYAAGSAATGAEVGEVFQYRVDAPVSIERQRSAMIPILSAQVPGRRVSIFNVADGQPYPRRGVEITNKSGLQLLAGPISVFDGGGDADATYAGDAQVGQVPAGDKRLLSYALDLNVNATTKDVSDSRVMKLRIVDGLFERTTKRIAGATYDFSNKDTARARTIIVEHARFDGWKLVEPAKADEETPDLYRFELPVDASKKTSITVRQELIENQRFAVTDYDLNTVLEFHKQGTLSDAVLAAIREIAKRQSEINGIEREIAASTAQTEAITNEQSRIRSNMNTIDRNSQLYGKYMTKLSEQETQLEQIGQRRADAQTRLEERRSAMVVYIRGLNVE